MNLCDGNESGSGKNIYLHMPSPAKQLEVLQTVRTSTKSYDNGSSRVIWAASGRSNFDIALQRPGHTRHQEVHDAKPLAYRKRTQRIISLCLCSLASVGVGVRC